jgi:hypothetical protein
LLVRSPTNLGYVTRHVAQLKYIGIVDLGKVGMVEQIEKVSHGTSLI